MCWETTLWSQNGLEARDVQPDLPRRWTCRPIITRVWTQLTHLDFWISLLYDPSFNLTHPLLHTLRIFTQKRDGTPEQADVPGTIAVGQYQPRIAPSAMLHGRMDGSIDARRSAGVHLTRISRSRPHQTLHVRYDREHIRHCTVFSESTWSWLPALRVVGTNLKQVSLMTAPGNHGRAPINLLIDPETNLIKHVPPEELLAATRQNWALSPTGEVVINEP